MDISPTSSHLDTNGTENSVGLNWTTVPLQTTSTLMTIPENANGREEFTHLRPRAFRVATAFVLLIVVIFVVVVNGTTIYCIRSYSPILHLKVRVFLMNLAAADVYLGITMLGILVTRAIIRPNRYGNMPFALLGAVNIFATVTSSGVSLYTMMALAVDRYIELFKPEKHSSVMTITKAKYIIITIWGYISTGTAVMVISALIKKDIDNMNPYEPIAVNNFLPPLVFKYVLLPHLLIPLVVCFVIYTCIFREIRRKFREVAPEALPTKFMKSVKLTQMMVLILGLLLVTWTPYGLFSIIVDISKSGTTITEIYTFDILVILALCNSAMNPFVYALQNKMFRQAYRSVLTCNLLLMNE